MDYEVLILIFTSIVYEALPFIVLGVVLAGLLEEFVPQQAIAKIIPRNKLLAMVIGCLLGIVFPMCECGIVVVMRRLLRKGLPLGVCVSYMLAGPVINVVVIASTYAAFNVPDKEMAIYGGPIQVVLLRCGLAFIVALNTGLIVDWLQSKHGNKALLAPMVLAGLTEGLELIDQDDRPKSWAKRLSNISSTSLNDFVDIMAFLILGACLAAGGRILLKEMDLEKDIQAQPVVAIVAMMVIAVLFCLCSEADAFVAANFPAYWPAASKLSFLVLGPMMDLKLYLMYTRVFRGRLIFTIITAVVVQVFCLTVFVHYYGAVIHEWIVSRL